MREKINKLAKGNIDDVRPLIKIIPERLDFVTQKGELIKADVLLKTQNHVPMKALAYSQDPRAKVLTPSFGGSTAVLRLQFNYAVYDTEGSYSGEILLVTNGGEFRLPYTITIHKDKNEELFDALKSIEDFDKIACTDESAALRLFQYNNFTDAAFMRDPVVLMLYGAFSGRPDKLLAMRQFIRAVRRYTGKDAAEYKSGDTGYAVHTEYAEVKAETDDLQGDDAIPKADAKEQRPHSLRYYFARYYRERLDYEIGECESEELLQQMKATLDEMSEYELENPFITLLKAENVLLSGDSVQAAGILGSVKTKIQNNRQRYLDEYFLLEFINCRINSANSRCASYIRLLRKFIAEEKKSNLFIYLIRTDDTIKRDSGAFHDLMHRLYDDGYRSPFLYLEYVRFLNEHPEYLHDPTGLDMNALFFGCRNDMLSEKLVAELVSRATLLNLNNILYYPIFASLYKKTKSDQLLQAICSTLIRADRRETLYHHWYAAGVEHKIQINGIYEYYLYTAPSCEPEIAEDVLVHFSGPDSLDGAARGKLYGYVASHKDTDSLIYRVYEPKIRAFALSMLKERRINSELAVIYRRLFESRVDLEEYYDYLPEILCTHRYACADEDIKGFVALYPQLHHEHVFTPDEAGTAYIPVISDDMIVLAQDAYGNRYCDREVSAQRLFDEKELMDICRFRCPKNLIVQLITADGILKAEDISDEQIHILENAAESLPLSDTYKGQIDRRLIDFYDSEASQGFKSGYMQAIRKADLDRRYRSRLVGAQIRAGLYQEAFAGICMDGFDDVDSAMLQEMCTKLILSDASKKREQLLQVALETMKRNCCDKLTLDFLCEHFNGSSQDMYNVLENAINDGIDTGDLEERLLAQLIFVDDTALIDRVFGWYVQRKRASEQIVKAYFTIRTYRYFLYDEPTDGTVFEYIESVIAGLPDPTALPVIHQLALTRFYSQQERCTQEQIKIAEVLVRSLFLKGYAFPYFKKLGQYFKLPRELQDDVMTVYAAKGASKPYVMTRLEPGESEYRLDSLKRMYKSLYVLDKIIFDDEKLYYEIYEIEDGIDTLKAQGVLSPQDNRCGGEVRVENVPEDAEGGDRHRFNRINEMIGNFKSGDETALRRNMDEYMTGSRIVSKLFNRGK